jgi:hypothetical protein
MSSRTLALYGIHQVRAESTVVLLSLNVSPLRSGLSLRTSASIACTATSCWRETQRSQSYIMSSVSVTERPSQRGLFKPGSEDGRFLQPLSVSAGGQWWKEEARACSADAGSPATVGGRGPFLE